MKGQLKTDDFIIIIITMVIEQTGSFSWKYQKVGGVMRKDRSSVGQKESWGAKDKRGEDRDWSGVFVCVCVCFEGGVRGFVCREHIHQGSLLVSNWSNQ